MRPQPLLSTMYISKKCPSESQLLCKKRMEKVGEVPIAQRLDLFASF